jgi:hypothetical protein
MAKVFLTDNSNDLYLNSSNHLAIGTRDVEIAAQLARNFIWTFLGEVFTDTELGLDYFGIVLSEFTSLQDKLNELARVLLTVPFVIKVESIAYTQDKKTGVITFNPIIKTTDGESVTLNDIRVV